ncbi:MAG: histidine kinase N-terminal domain-containing protein [Ignavibacteria bacterium]|jgi:hypothetical protein
MRYLSLIKSAESNIKELSKIWMKEIKQSEYAPTYNSLDEDKVYERGCNVFENLFEWFNEGANIPDIQNYYEKVGAERNREGFPLTEVIFAVYLTKKIFGEFLGRSSIVESFTNKELLEFNELVNSYFDQGIFHITKGYLNQLFDELDATKKFSTDELKVLLTQGKLDLDDVDDEDFIWRHI